jgi:hypothetical protein
MGTLKLGSIPPGRDTLVVEAEGFEIREIPIEVREARITLREVILRPAPER